jgi:hypothetical protein
MSLPFVGFPQKPADFSHPANFQLGGKGGFKDAYDFVGLGEICEIFNVHRRSPWDQGPNEDTWIVWHGVHPNFLESQA